VSASIFGSAHTFLHSTAWHVIEFGALAVLILFYCATVFWVYKDVRRRLEEPLLVAAATVLGAVPPLLGPLIYMLFRPPEYLDDVRERALEIKAIETRLGGPSFRCSVCGCGVEPDFLICPVCTTKLRQACTGCRRPLEPAWQVCPYCETPAGAETQVSLVESQQRSLPTGTRSSR
jgi:hypothetical protein